MLLLAAYQLLIQRVHFLLLEGEASLDIFIARNRVRECTAAGNLVQILLGGNEITRKTLNFALIETFAFFFYHRVKPVYSTLFSCNLSGIWSVLQRIN